MEAHLQGGALRAPCCLRAGAAILAQRSSEGRALSRSRSLLAFAAGSPLTQILIADSLPTPACSQFPLPGGVIARPRPVRHAGRHHLRSLLG